MDATARGKQSVETYEGEAARGAEFSPAPCSGEARRGALLAAAVSVVVSFLSVTRSEADIKHVGPGTPWDTHEKIQAIIDAPEFNHIIFDPGGPDDCPAYRVGWGGPPYNLHPDKVYSFHNVDMQTCASSAFLIHDGGYITITGSLTLSELGSEPTTFSTIHIGQIHYDNIVIQGLTFIECDYAISGENRLHPTPVGHAAITVNNCVFDGCKKAVKFGERLGVPVTEQSPYAAIRNSTLNGLRQGGPAIDLPRYYDTADEEWVVLGQDGLENNVLIDCYALSNPDAYDIYTSPSDNAYDEDVEHPYLKEEVPVDQKDSVGNFVTSDPKFVPGTHVPRADSPLNLGGGEYIGAYEPEPLTLGWTGGEDNTWDTSSAENWVYYEGTYGYSDGCPVVFNDTGTYTEPVEIVDTVEPSSVLVENESAAITFAGPGGIAGTCGLTKQGGGTLTIATANAYTGETQIYAGTVAVAADGALGTGAVRLGAPEGASDASLLVGGPFMVENGITVQDGGSGTSTRILGGTHTVGTAAFSGDLTLGADLLLTAEPGGEVRLEGTLGNGDGHTLTKVGDGTVVFAGPQDHGSGSLLEVQEGLVVLNTDASGTGLMDEADLSILVAGAELHVGCDQHLDTLEITESGLVRFTGANVVVVKHLVMNGTDLGATTLTPEPATLALLAVGAAAAVVRNRRKRKGRAPSSRGITGWTGQ